MKNIIIKSILFILIIGSATSCLDYEDLRENPNNPNSVPPSLLFTQLTPGTTNSFTDTYINYHYHLWASIDGISFVNMRSGLSGGFSYGSIRNIYKMMDEADKAGAPEYSILAKFYMARAYIEMTRRMGDIPLTEAMMGVENPRPKYDTSKSVYIQALNWLDEASLELGSFISENPGHVLEGDAYYKGDLIKWHKLINSYTLRILISLSKKENDTEVNIKGRFSNIINNPDKYPLMTSLADNAQLNFSNEDGFKQTYQPDNGSYQASVVYASTYIDMLKSYNDPRLFIIADPTQAAMNASTGDPATVKSDPNSYEGADPTIDPSDNITRSLAGELSKPNQEKYWNYVGQPGVFLSYWEQEFTIAEAAHRGWISNSAQEHYNNAVTASMEWYGAETDDIATYLAASVSQYTTGDLGLKRILEQKYLAFAENSGTESFFNMRRTGIPSLPYSEFNIPASDPGIPVRWTYPSSELSDNEANLKAALVRQFGAETDDID
ncbi:MAG: SusD/RagB family nutrient-binding outer membrane lipoprotein, partial [Arenibacter latericius]|nr:SusD/RagB family nutrient-binding outer membrane lipoprotein [Arenibacter latericius]